MEGLPGNSHRERNARAQEEKKVEKVVTGPVSRSKKPLGRRFSETIFGGDGKGVLQYIFLDILVPAMKDTIVDVVSQGIERAVLGEARTGTRRTGGRTPGAGGYTSYNRYSTPSHAGRRDDPRDSPRRRREHELDDIILATRIEAGEVLARMDDLLKRYETVSVSDLYDLLGLEGSYVDEKWGWTNLDDADVRRVRDGYLLILPEREPLTR